MGNVEDMGESRSKKMKVEMRNFSFMKYALILFAIGALVNCTEDEPRGFGTSDPDPEPEESVFYFGADLSYVNQILDKGGVYMDSGVVESPYVTFQQYGTNLARFRVWHNPAWTQELYGDDGTQMYNEANDVARAIGAAKSAGMEVLLDFHYSDDWADPGSQRVPEAWTDITSLSVLGDSVYNYTSAVLTLLDDQGLMPEYVQIGNETNCGMMYQGAPDAFPPCNVCDGNWANFGQVARRAIRAVRDVSSDSEIDTKIMFHVADPVNVNWWFEGLTTTGSVTDFEVIGFSYYPLWHTGVRVNGLENAVAAMVESFNKEVMILETAYPWTLDGDDNYNNLFGGDNALTGYPYSPQGQQDLMRDIVQAVINGGGSGVIYWEPAWISSDMRDRWGTGSSWENNTFYDYDGNANHGFDYLGFEYQFPE